MRRRVFILLYVMGIGVLACNLGSPGITQPPPTSASPSQSDASPTAAPSPATATIVLTSNDGQSQAAACQVRQDWPVYVATSGDTINGIAQRAQMSPSELIHANCLSDPNRLSVGQPIHVPRALAGAPQTSVNASPLVFLKPSGTNIGGDLWTWTITGKNLKQLTTWGYNQQPVISPDGRRIAYLSVSQAAVDFIKRTGPGQGLPPANIWIMNVVTGDALRVADQPPGASFEQLISRTTQPSWSPDAQSLAWVETENGRDRLVVYDVGQKTSRVMPLDLPAVCCGDLLGRQTLWGTPGIAVLSFEGSTPATNQLMIHLYSPAGTLLRSVGAGPRSLLDWITAGNKAYLAGQDDQGKWSLIDPLAGQTLDMPGVPELYSLTAPNGATASPNSAPSAGKTHWRFRFASSEIQLDDVAAYTGVTVSPDGNYIAVQQGLEGSPLKLKIYGNASQVSDAAVGDIYPGLTWGPTGWRVRSGS